ncbi:hypothetical protein Hanom_Chr03g00197021 [Helianthus anomalus]
MLERLGISDENSRFDFEDDLDKANPNEADDYVFKNVDEVNDFDNVVMEDDSESNNEGSFHYSGAGSEDFPTYTKLFSTHNKDEFRRRVKERIHDEDLKVYAIKGEFGVQYFKYLKDLKNLPWWDIEELVKMKNILQYIWGPEIDPVTGEKDITLHIKRPRCMKNMPLKKIEPDFYREFKGWYYDPKTCEAVISLRNKDNWMWRSIRVLDPMWLVNCSKKDIECSAKIVSRHCNLFKSIETIVQRCLCVFVHFILRFRTRYEAVLAVRSTPSIETVLTPVF